MINRFQTAIGINLQVASLRERVTGLFFSTPFGATSYQDASSQTNKAFLNPKKIKRFFRKSIYLPFIVVIVLVIIVAIFALRGIAQHQTSAQIVGANNSRVQVNPAIAQETLNKEFDFPLKDQTGKQISTLKYEIQNAELRDEIIIQGQKATAVKGRFFLVLNLKITNSYDKSVQVNARDYVRLSVNNSSEKLAPDIHNDPVEVQAISTKLTRIGFPINDTDRNLMLQVGEISGKKQLIPLTIH